MFDAPSLSNPRDADDVMAAMLSQKNASPPEFTQGTYFCGALCSPRQA